MASEPPGRPFDAIPQARGDDFPAVIAVEHYGRHRGNRGIAEVPQASVGPAGANLHPAGKHKDHGRTTGGQSPVQTFDHAGAPLGLDKPHLIAEIVGVAIRLVVDDENFAVGRTILQHGKQGIVQLLRIA